MAKITRDQLDELLLILRDLRMAMNMKDEIAQGADRGLARFADGTKISVPIPESVKGELDSKITQLSTLFKEKVASLEV